MPEMNQNNVDDLLNQLQAGNNALVEDAAKALAQATATAGDIASDVASTGAAPAPQVPALDEPLVPDPADAIPTLPKEVQRLLAIEVPVIVQLGGRRMTVSEVMRLAVGAIIEISKSADEELELLVNNKPVGKGEAVKVGENFGIRIKNIGSVKEIVRKLGAA